MKLALLALVALVVSSGAGIAEPLNEKSKAPDWGRASQAEKDAWIGAFQFRQAAVDKAEVGACLDKHALEPLFETNDLSGVTQMCGTIAALE